VSTVQQNIKRVRNQYKRYLSAALFNCPQARGYALRVRITTPRKPNSARRATVKVKLNNKRRVVSYIPGKGHNVRKHSDLLIRGGGARDLPGVYYTCIRGVLDLAGVLNKTKRRSIYGIEQPAALKLILRRRYRNI
jgi:small subunit ribosomal protein S12